MNSNNTTPHDVTRSPLGKNSSYVSSYSPELLFPIPRIGKRNEIHVPDILPFFGFDTWNAYEVSWLTKKGKPQNAIIQFDINAHSKNIVESKSFKLYLNSFNNTRLSSSNELEQLLKNDIAQAVEGEVHIKIYTLDDFLNQKIETFEGVNIDEEDIELNEFDVNPELLEINNNNKVVEVIYSHLLKSNCLVTGQPDWGSIQISYHGPQIDRKALLKYLISFRNHNEFHEQCVERIFMDIQTHCKPSELTVTARYTRRGGLDINPARSSKPIAPMKNIRMARQ